jgi:hypothetical protein
MASDRHSSVDPVFRRRRLSAVASVFAPAWFAAGGCANMNQLFPQSSTVRVLPTAPTMADVIAVINNNTNLVRSLYSADASLSAPLTPTLRATFAVERPRRLRLRAETALTGPELDVGSNDQLFWLWMKRQTPPSIFYCRHEQYAQSAARQMFPVQPEWLIDALGLPTVDPAGQHQGPTPVERGKLRLQSQLVGPFGPQTRTITIDAARGWILEQQLYDAGGQLLATSRTSNHTRDPASGATLPRHIEINWPATQFQANIDFRSVQVNTLMGAQASLFELPQMGSTPTVDLAAPGMNLLAPQR